MAAGFRADQPAYFQWLGVVPYLSREAIVTTLDFMAGIPESEVVFDYAEPLENFSPEIRTNVAAIAARAASVGEPWLSFFRSGRHGLVAARQALSSCRRSQPR